MNEEEKKAINNVKRWKDNMQKGTRVNIINKGDVEFCNDLKKVLNLIDKQNKVIDEMAQGLIDMPIKQFKANDLFIFTNKEDTKQYFIRKVEEDVQ